MLKEALFLFLLDFIVFLCYNKININKKERKYV